MGETFFTSMTVIGGKIFSNNPKNMNHFHKYSKYLLSVIITLGNNMRGGNTVFYDGLKSTDLGSRAHILKKLHGIMIFGPLFLTHEVNLCRGPRSVISLIITKQIFLHLYCHWDQFYNQYIDKKTKQILMMMILG